MSMTPCKNADQCAGNAKKKLFNKFTLDVDQHQIEK